MNKYVKWAILLFVIVAVITIIKKPAEKIGPENQSDPGSPRQETGSYLLN